MTDSIEPWIRSGDDPLSLGGERGPRLAGVDSGDALVGHLVGLLVRVLAGIPALNSHAHRDRLRDELSYRFQDLDLRGRKAPEEFFAHVVLRCADLRGGLAELSILVEQFAPAAADGLRAQRLIDELEALKIEPGLADVWNPLHSELILIPLRHIQAMILAATDGRSPTFPPHCRDTWAVFIHLVGQNTPPGGQLPPWLTFMELVRDRFSDDATAILVRDLTRRLARAWRRTAELERARARFDAQTPAVVRTATLSIVMAPDPEDLDLFTLHSVQRWDGNLFTPIRSGEVLSHRVRLSREVERLLSAAEEHCAAMAVELRVEFVLPLALINEPVEWWPKDSNEDPPSMLSVYHQVVVRSYERMHRPAWHRVWLSRWRQLDQAASVRVFWADSTGEEGHASRLEAILGLNQDYVAVVLSRPPQRRTGNSQELVVALRAGIPLIIWHRQDETTSAVRRVIAELVSDPRSAPQTLHTLRGESEQLSPALRDTHPARNLSILWDDAEPGARLTQSEARLAHDGAEIGA